MSLFPRISAYISSHRHLQEWAKFTKSRTARHKLAKFLKEHGDLLPEHYKVSNPLEATPPPQGRSREASGNRLSNGSSAGARERDQTVWLAVEGDDGPGLLAELAQIIDKHGHDVKARACPAVQSFPLAGNAAGAVN